MGAEPVIRGPFGGPPRTARRAALRAFAVVLACSALGASSARASESDDALRAGVAARDRARESQFVSDWQSAFELFQRAVALQDDAAARFELAEAAAALGRIDLAFESYELALAKGLSGKADAIARAYLEAHAADVAKLAILAPAGTRVSVDERERARLPLARPLVVPAGSAHVELAAPDGTRYDERLQLEPGALRRIALTRGSSAPPPAARAARAGAPASAPDPVVPAHRVDAEEPAWLSRHPGAIALIAVAGASLAAGGAFAFKAHDVDQDAADTRSQIMAALQGHVDSGVLGVSSVPCGANGVASGIGSFGPGVGDLDRASIVEQYAHACYLMGERSARADRYARVAYAGMGVGLAAAAVLLTWYVASPSSDAAPDDRAPQALVAPLLSADTQGLMLELEF